MRLYPKHMYLFVVVVVVGNFRLIQLDKLQLTGITFSKLKNLSKYEVIARMSLRERCRQSAFDRAKFETYLVKHLTNWKPLRTSFLSFDWLRDLSSVSKKTFEDFFKTKWFFNICGLLHCYSTRSVPFQHFL